ncbi:hypothetical protein [Vibrio metschnikovii]|uniref:hypothetical protein n=1 Tax=Vibrio metschnikovii TaxID=28172 RepID=UPI002FCB56D9
MEKLGYCEIKGFKLTRKSKKAVSDIRHIMKQGNLFSSSVSTIPLFQIFASPSVTGSAFEMGITIREHDWEMFGRAMNSSTRIVRSEIFKIAYYQEIYTYGEERKFWRCVSEASM